MIVLRGLTLGALLFPLYWMLVASFTPEARLFEAPALVPTTFSLEHYRALFDTRDFLVPVKNSLVVAGLTTLFVIPIAALSAYALARMPFRGKRLLLALVLAVSMFPQISIVAPLYLGLRTLGWLNTYPGLVLP